MPDKQHTPHHERVSTDEIKRIAKLSMIEVPETDINALQNDFENILDLFETLRNENLDTISVQYTAEKTAQSPRPDVILHDTETQVDKLTMISPYFNKKSHYFDVPPVIETE